MRQFLIAFCLWVLQKMGAEPFYLSDEVKRYEDEITALCLKEQPLVHGSRDILGDGWLKLRRVATAFKRTHPEVRNRNIFKAVVHIADKIDV